jgi:uncharacterized protein YkwD
MRIRARRLALLGLAVASFAMPARADLVAEANRIRAQGCGVPQLSAGSLRAHRLLHAAARFLASGRDLNGALEAVGYQAVASAFVRVTTPGNDRAAGELLRKRFCLRVADARFTEIGVHRVGDRRWLVLAQPFSATVLKDSHEVTARVLALVNEARSRARRCGRERFAAAAPLSVVPALERSALAHAQDMARHSRLDHTGSDGSTPGERLQRTGYQRRLVGENIAAGRMTPEEVVRGWLDSPEHCANVMDARFRHMGIAYAINPTSRHRIYWAQVFAAPR